MKIPTKQHKKDWHHQIIINLLKRADIYKQVRLKV